MIFHRGIEGRLARLESQMSALSDKIAKVQTDVDSLKQRVAADLQNVFTPADLAALDAVDAEVNAIDPAPAPAPAPAPPTS